MKNFLFPLLLAGLIVALTYSVVWAALAGDIDGNGQVDLDDLTSNLRILCGFNAAAAPVEYIAVDPSRDANRDGHYGSEDAIYVAQVANDLERSSGKALPSSALLFSSAMLWVVPFRRKKGGETGMEADK
jgi:hypothetical protein